VPLVEHAVDADLLSQHLVEDDMGALQQRAETQRLQTRIARQGPQLWQIPEFVQGVEQASDGAVSREGSLRFEVAVEFQEVRLGSAEDPDR
jgi:hypothetical protein